MQSFRAEKRDTADPYENRVISCTYYVGSLDFGAIWPSPPALVSSRVRASPYKTYREHHPASRASDPPRTTLCKTPRLWTCFVLEVSNERSEPIAPGQLLTPFDKSCRAGSDSREPSAAANCSSATTLKFVIHRGHPNELGGKSWYLASGQYLRNHSFVAREIQTAGFASSTARRCYAVRVPEIERSRPDDGFLRHLRLRLAVQKTSVVVFGNQCRATAPRTRLDGQFIAPSKAPKVPRPRAGQQEDAVRRAVSRCGR